MSKLQQHIDLLDAECEKMLKQLEKDDYTVNELINMHKRVLDITGAKGLIENVLRIQEQRRSRIVAPPPDGLNGLKIH